MYLRLSIFLSLVLFFSCQTKNTDTQKETMTSRATSQAPEPAINIDLNFIMGKFDPAKDSTFVKIPRSYADQEGRYMKEEAFVAFQQMAEAAKKDGIDLIIRSAARNFNYQKGIWERKWTGETKLSTGEDASKEYSRAETRAKKILEYSSMPGTSRHHWGTDIDLNNFNNEWFESGEGLKIFNWLEENAEKYGYCRPYTKKDTSRPDGYNEEKWHWSYTPLSDQYTQYAEQYLKANMISGFLGSEVSDSIDVVDKYVLGINHICNSH